MSNDELELQPEVVEETVEVEETPKLSKAEQKKADKAAKKAEEKAKKEAKKAEKEAQPQENDRSEYNCTVCGGDGLVVEGVKTSLCSYCNGTGKV